MTVPQPFQYQGSKRALAPLILQYLPISTTWQDEDQIKPGSNIQLAADTCWPSSDKANAPIRSSFKIPVDKPVGDKTGISSLRLEIQCSIFLTINHEDPQKLIKSAAPRTF